MVDLFTGVVIFAAMSAATTAVFATIYSKLRGERFVRDWFLLVVLVAVGLFGTTLQYFTSFEWVVVLANA